MIVPGSAPGDYADCPVCGAAVLKVGYWHDGRQRRVVVYVGAAFPGPFPRRDWEGTLVVEDGEAAARAAHAFECPGKPGEKIDERSWGR